MVEINGEQRLNGPKIAASTLLTSIMSVMIVMVVGSLLFNEPLGLCQSTVEATPGSAPKSAKSSRKQKPAKTPTTQPDGPAAGASNLTPPQSGVNLFLSGKYLHFSCSRSVRDLERNRFECFGNVYIRRPSELLTADYVAMDMNTQQLRAEGNVVYFTPDTVIYGSNMDYNFLTEMGIIEDGRVESDKYQLLGERIERRAVDRFWARDGEYTTCRDCPASWKIVGRSIDLTVNGYARLSDVFIKINEAPTLYLPYIIIPVKTQRQSGLLFPRIQLASSNGFTLVQPYFWAISRSADATLGLGYYTVNGMKAEGEFRYVLSERTQGQLNTFYLHDKKFPSGYENRWAVNYRHNLELPWKIEQKLSWLDVSDREYIRKIGDIQNQDAEPNLISEAGFSRVGRDASAWVNAKRIRNMISPNLKGFDASTVQLFPSATLTSADHRLMPEIPLYWGVTGNYSKFWRPSGSYDPATPGIGGAPPVITDNGFVAGQTPLRRAQRFSLVPEIYLASKIGDVLDFVPSVQYRSYYYQFDQPTPSTTRGYLLAQTEVSTTLESVYGGKVKHKFRPSLTYSNIPIIRENKDHPFIQQIKTPGYQFDEVDIVPVTFETQRYFVPLGNSLTYRLNNSFILKTPGAKPTDPVTYKKVVDVTAGQSVNFIELRKSKKDQQPLSRFFTLLTVDTLRIHATGEYDYYPYINAPTYNLALSYYFAKYTRRLLTFERSVTFNYNLNQVTTNANAIGGSFNWSVNDMIALTGGIAYAFPQTQSGAETPGLLLNANGGLVYQSPSQCYKIVLAGGWRRENPTVEVGLNFPINLTGEGFADLQEGGGLATQTGTK